MKKMLLISLVFFITLFGAEVASAHRWTFGFGVHIPPPVIVAPPATVYPYPAPPLYYGPRSYYPHDRPPYVGYRSWVSGFWDWRWTQYGWQRVWFPGHWKYR
jgi:hypothetical protein